MDTKMQIEECYLKFHAHEFDNEDEMGQFLQRHNLPKLVQGEIDHLNSYIQRK